MWCGGGHLHKECPEKENAASIPACSNCRLAEGEKLHLANYRGCRHAKELQKRKLQATPKPTPRRVFSSTTPGVFFATAVRGSAVQHQTRQVPAAEPAAEVKTTSPRAPHQKPGQSVPAPTVNSQPLHVVRVVTVVQQIMTELTGAVSEEEKIMAITRIVFNLMKRNGH
jgi:hypothetical protein